MKKLLLSYFLFLISILSLPKDLFAQNVGIGTNNPATLLHVFNGDLLVRGNSRTYYLTDAGTAFNNSIITADQSAIGGHAGILIKGNNPFSNYPNLSFSLQNSNARTVIGGSITGIITNHSAGEETMDIQFYAKPPGGQITEYLRITSAGNVGIGTTAPGEKLTIVSADNNSVTNIGAFYPNNLTQGIGIGFDEIRKIGTNANGNLYINAKGSGNLILQNSTTGYVGIGTAAPAAKLEITHNGASTFGTALLLNQTAIGNSDGPKIQFTKTMTSTKSWTAGILNGVNVGSFNIDEDGGTFGFGSSRFCIIPGGNVGIGTTGPSEKLEINGNVKSNSYLYNSPKTHYYSIPPTAFQPSNNSDFVVIYASGAEYLSNNVWGAFFAPVLLPDGAIVTSLTVYYYDGSTTSDLRVVMYAKVHNSSLLEMTGFLTAGVPGATSFSSSSINHAQIDNQARNYSIQFQSWLGSSNAFWPANQLQIRSVVITYTISETQ